MSNYGYQVRDAGGTVTSGVLAAGDIGEATRMLRAGGNTIVALNEQRAAEIAAAPKKVGHDDIIFFATQLAVMVDTGVPLSEALDGIAEQSDHSGVKALIKGIADDVRSGLEFSAALAKYPRHFDDLFVALVRASEASGTMGLMLQRGSEYMEQAREIRKRVVGAMTYPVCMLGFCVLVVTGLMIFILPRFAKIYEGKGALLPAPTRMLMALSSFIIGYWWAILLVLGVIVGGWMYFMRTPEGRIFKDKVRIHLPLLGGMYRKASLCRGLRTMATMISAGVGMLDALAITAQAAGNHFYSVVWNSLAEGVKEGSSLSEELFRFPIIPRSIAQMISAGEKTGKLGPVMNRIAGFCEEDLKTGLKTMTSMIEPIMIVIMGVIVGGIAMALLLPVLTMSQVLAK